MILSNSNRFPNYVATIRRVDAIVDIPGMDKLAKDEINYSRCDTIYITRVII